jgi:hypothetical protein
MKYQLEKEREKEEEDEDGALQVGGQVEASWIPGGGLEAR